MEASQLESMKKVRINFSTGYVDSYTYWDTNIPNSEWEKMTEDEQDKVIDVAINNILDIWITLE